MQAELIMLEAICLVVLGTIAEIVRDKTYGTWDAIDNLILAVIIGVALFSMFGEPSTASVIPYMAAGYSSSEALEHLFKPWWESS